MGPKGKVTDNDFAGLTMANHWWFGISVALSSTVTICIMSTCCTVKVCDYKDQERAMRVLVLYSLITSLARGHSLHISTGHNKKEQTN